ncbi:Fc.00g045620.m01.CDS01 [Cosmosporella sp. VM-42]
MELAKLHLDTTLQFIHWSLSLNEHKDELKSEDCGEPSGSKLAKVHFGEFGDMMRSIATIDTRKRLYRQIRSYTKQLKKEQETKFKRRLQAPDAYMEMRLGTSASYTLTTFIE